MLNIKQLLSRDNPLAHYIHHFLVANIALFIAYLVFGSITVWEIILFFFMTYIPVFDELFYAVLHYLDTESCREITHLFIAGEYTKTLGLLHKHRATFTRLVLHNFLLYGALLSLLYIFLIFDIPLAFYALAGLLIHLMEDIANDEYEFNSVSRWLWPVNFLLNQHS